MGPARHRDVDRHLAASRIPDRRGRQGHRGGRVAYGPRGTALQRTVSRETRSHGKRVLAALVCGAALLASGCGSDNEGKDLPPSSVSDLEASLASIQRRFELGGGACQDITQGDDTDVKAVQNKIDALPSDVDKDVKDALQESFDNLFDLVERECKQTETTPTETTPTETTPPETTPPETTPTETTPTETTPPQTNTTPDNNQGNDNGGGGQKAPKEKKEKKQK